MNKVTIRYRHKNSLTYHEREVTHCWFGGSSLFFEDRTKTDPKVEYADVEYFSIVLNPEGGEQDDLEAFKADLRRSVREAGQDKGSDTE